MAYIARRELIYTMNVFVSHYRSMAGNKLRPTLRQDEMNPEESQRLGPHDVLDVREDLIVRYYVQRKLTVMRVRSEHALSS